MKLPVYNIEGKIVKELDYALFDVVDVRYDLIHTVINWQLSKKRSSIAHVKSVSEVAGSTRKIYRQKGTGRARHGSSKRAQFRGGAVVFGPSNQRKFLFKVNKKVRTLSLFHTLSLKIREGSVTILDKFAQDIVKTKDFVRHFPVDKASKVLFVASSLSCMDPVAFRNLPNVDYLSIDGVNSLDLYKANRIYFQEDEFNNFVSCRFAK